MKKKVLNEGKHYKRYVDDAFAIFENEAKCNECKKFYVHNFYLLKNLENLFFC